MTRMNTMTSPPETESNTNQKVAVFMAGFTLAQVPRLAVSAGKFSAVRFRISSSYIPLFLNQMIISYRIAALLGTMVMNGLILGCPNFKQHLGIVSSICTSSMSLCYALTLVTFYTGGDQGYITAYYWGIVLTSFMYGCSVVSVTTLASSEIAGYLAAIPAASIVSSSYHLSFVKFGNKFRLQNINYWVVVWQIITAICLAVIAAGIWIVAYGDGKAVSSGTTAEEDDFWTGLSLSGSPLFLAAFGYGLQYAFYPAIAPYKLAGIQKGFYISLALLYTGAIPPAILLYLKEAKKGPDKNWTEYYGWHYAWFLFALEVTCAYIFTIILHYPDGFIARTLRHSTILLTLVIVLYDMCVHTTRGIGSNGASRQTKEGNSKKNSKMATLNTLLYSITQLIFAFMGNGYLKTYSKYEKDPDNWPTKHFTTRKAFWYWCGCSTKCACKNLVTAFTTDVRGSIVEKREFLYVVYADEVDNSRKPPNAKDPTVMKIVHDI
ncbi:conserved hypothetical protein [Theileria equi strain WA]|uniref:Uncharacterized protein n=1 Tax=Theileria equi strain WA TaxID=1537102 RepID=L1LA33_THEEQ|nr:conserved hypothetical protein [Theileria equi strain WA]EKX72109.1 conserved hypothetical protein [Theileria equi strain WA]|eukprot:XP_004831561.1 conserved hypothetical protein [Theileria equi strain WA]